MRGRNVCNNDGRALLLGGLAALALGLALSPVVAASPSGVVSLEGVTPLRLFESTEADVRLIAGPPDRRSITRSQEGERYRTLHYGCRGRRPRERYRTCVSEYQIDMQSGRLVAFASRSRRVRTVRGVRVGMSRRQAQARELRFRSTICSGLVNRGRRSTIILSLSTKDRYVADVMLFAGELGSVYDNCY